MWYLKDRKLLFRVFSVDVRNSFFFEQAGSRCHTNRTDAGPSPPASAQWNQENESNRFSRQLILGFRQSSPIVPGHPILGIFPDKRAVFLKGNEVIEWIGFDKAIGENLYLLSQQKNKINKIAHIGSFLGFTVYQI